MIKLIELLEKLVSFIWGKIAMIFAPILKFLPTEKIRAQLEKVGKVFAFVGEKIKVILSLLILPLTKLSEISAKLAETKTKAVVKAKNLKKEDFNPAKFIGIIAAFLLPVFLKIQKWIMGLRPEMLLVVVTASALGGLALVSTVSSGKKIYKEATNYTPPPPPKFNDGKKPDYYKRSEKFIFISDVILPVYIESATSTKTLNMDLTLQMSNRYLKQYFYDNEHLLKNRINETVEPIIPGFPLTEEGKIILKDKIKKELNILIKQLEIKGRVENVFFHGIIGG